MGSCCNDHCAAEVLREKQRGTLINVLFINAVMFVIILLAAFYSKSTALLSDSLDNLGDALTYGLSLYVVSKSSKMKASVALFKGGLIFLGASVVVIQVFWRILYPIVPTYEVMGGFSLAGLAANGLCLWLLWRHRNEDINMSSVYECSRNDIASNLSVFFTSFFVYAFQSGWPDILIASCLAILLIRSSLHVILGAFREMNKSA